MLDSCFKKLLSVVLSLVEPDDVSHIKVLEHLEVVLRLVASPLCFVVNRTHEGDEFFGNDPVQVSILNLLVVVVLFGIEVSKVVPA